MPNIRVKQDFHITVCASGGGGNFQALIDNRQTVGYEIDLLIVDRECGAMKRAFDHGIRCALLRKQVLKGAFFDRMDQEIPRTTDLIVLAGFMPIISSAFCTRWKRRIINTHPSLLPKYGGKGMYGVKVHEAVMKAKESVAGCTVHFVNEEIDGGEIILQKSLMVDYSQTAWELGGRIFKAENELLVDAIRLLKKNTAD